MKSESPYHRKHFPSLIQMFEKTKSFNLFRAVPFDEVEM